jgi:hypothetical protein
MKQEDNENKHVVLYGLKNKEEMNGMTGIRGNYIQKKRKYQVTLDKTGQTILLKPENMIEESRKHETKMQ